MRALDLVCDLLSRITGLPRSDIPLTALLVDDLAIDADDYGWAVREIEKRIGIRVAREQWEAVRTVQDWIDLVDTHMRERGNGVR